MLWVFGYGSLIWRPGFAFVERRPGFVRGLARRFWQGSTDHRGVPGAPGRVCTLVEAPKERCFGVAFAVDPAVQDEVLARLDHREKGGYERRTLTVEAEEGPVEALTFIATPSNTNWLGPAPVEEMAATVRASTGPSGTNLEYVLKLAEALRQEDASCDHTFALERALRATA